MGWNEEVAKDIEAAEKAVEDKANESKVAHKRISKALTAAIEGLGDDAAIAVLGAYKKIPEEVKRAVTAVYATIEGLGDDVSMGDLRGALKALRDECGDEYRGLYAKVLADSRERVTKVVAHLMTERLESDENI